MYGLMKAHACSRHRDDTTPYRLHYCGACKTMGRLYGQKARMLLNHDAVFLAELLTALSPGAEPASAWENAYQSYNCFALPETPEEMPLSLQIAASATLLMTEFKLEDQVEDAARGGWRLAQKLFSPAFYAAAERLNACGFPIATIRDWYRAQSGREAAVSAGQVDGPPGAILHSVAEPTAAVTGLVFQHGVAADGCTETVQQTMYKLGFAFGSLIYTLDALDDFAKDARRGDFNALKYAFDTTESTLPPAFREASVALLKTMQAQVESALRTLPLPAGYAAKFCKRLNSNLARRLGSPPESSCTTSIVVPVIPLREQWRRAWALARNFSRTPDGAPAAMMARLGQPFRFLTALGVALVFPQPVQTATSFRECRDIALNLMFVGGALSGLVSRCVVLAGAGGGALPNLTMDGGIPHSSSQPPHSGGPPQRRKVVRRSSGCCCGGGEGCCEGCACGCCEGCGEAACCEGVCCCADASCCAEGCCADASCCSCSTV